MTGSPCHPATPTNLNRTVTKGKELDTLRPSAWDGYIGQDRLKQDLAIRIDAALNTGWRLDHILLCAPPGAGKTSLAEMIADRYMVDFEMVTMPVTFRALANLIVSFDGVLLLDEIHRCSPKEQEMLLPLLEFGYIQDTSGRRIESDVITIVGATTERQKLITPLIDRFPIKPEFDEYSDDEMARITMSMAESLGLEISEEAATAFGVAATGTPRNARQFVLAYRDLIYSSDEPGGPPDIEAVLDLCHTASDGLTRRHVKYLETLLALGGTRGLPVLSSLLQQGTSELIEIERLLVTKNYLTYSDRGRELTSKGVRRARGDQRRTAPKQRRGKYDHTNDTRNAA